MTATRPATQLYCSIAAGPTARERLEAVLAGTTVSSVLIVAKSGTRLGAGEVKPLVELIQKHDVAALIENDAQLARVVRADGVHLNDHADILDLYGEARSILGERFIVGADAGRSKHHAMLLGEAGADYVGFGIDGDDADARQTRDDLVAWWTDIFEIPCVAFGVETADEAARLAHSGADFIALSITQAQSPAAARDFAQSLQAALAGGVS